VALCGSLLAAEAGAAQRVTMSVAQPSLCRHVTAAQISGVVGSKVRFLSAKAVGSNSSLGLAHVVQCVYGWASYEVVLASGTAAKAVRSPRALEKAVDHGGPDGGSARGIYNGLGVPAVIWKPHGVAGSPATLGIVAARGHHFAFTLAVPGMPLPLRTLGRLTLLAFSI